LRAWVVARAKEASEVLNDESFLVLDIGKPIVDMGRVAGEHFSHLVGAAGPITLFRNGDEHRAARRALNRAIARVPFRDLEPVIDSVAASSAADVARRGSFDAVQEFAGVLSARVMTHILGLSDSDRRLLQEVGESLTRTFDIVSPDVYEDVNRKVEAALQHLSKRVDEAVAAGEENGVTLLYEETSNAGQDRVAATAALILFAFAVGSVTTSALIAFAIDLLLADADLYGAARDDSSLAATVAAEAERLQSPVQRSLRVATKDRIVGGKWIRCGQRLVVMVRAANRGADDALAAPDAAQVPHDSRDSTAGAGRKVCVELSLRRIESRVALTHFLRLPPLERDGPPVFRSSITVPQLASLPVRFKTN
jgi:cytochrome P450